tara:strand:- start:5707 stop:7866 length:2160 start_codon:yes stop_codon:yes gene_type:complete
MKSLYILSFLSLSFCLSGCDNQKKKSDGPEISTKESKNLNRLANASSPYLQEHSDNPIDWYEWGPEALEKAKRENKPLIISIGYAACHWCHVMERESFMDPEIAKIMNENFVAIKIDREERPDIDQIYMNAAQLINGSGGWPLNAFTLPNGKPFFAGTYFPKDEWRNILNQISEVYKNEPEKIIDYANSLTEGIKQQDVIEVASISDHTFSKETYEGLWNNWKGIIDTKNGGFNRAPKFPLPIGWEFLLQYYHLTENDDALKAVNSTLLNMARGGIYDQLGGGFSRYSVDVEWFAPHFEKMLYDNAQLVSLYSKAYKVTGNKEYENIVHETLQFVERELSDKNGGFYSSINADSEGEEGKFYVWTSEEIEEIVTTEEANLLKDFYGIKKTGNWEKGTNILFRQYSKEEYAARKDLKLTDFSKKLNVAENKLMTERKKRKRPSTDDKILTSWNALMITAYLDAYTAFGEEKYRKKALEAIFFLEKNMLKKDNGLWRNYKDDEATIEAFLDDYALFANVYIKFYEVDLEKKWLDKALGLAQYTVDNFRDEKSGMFYYTSEESEQLIARKMELSDNVIPASNSVMAEVLYKLGHYYEKENFLHYSSSMLGQMQDKVTQGGPEYANWAMLMGIMAFQPFEIAIMGEDALEKNMELQKHYLPISLIMGGTKEDLPLLEMKLVENNTYIYVCRNNTCKLPVQETALALEQIKDYMNPKGGFKSIW